MYFGLSHDPLKSDAHVFLDNETMDGSSSKGCMNLKLKEHKIKLLDANPTSPIYHMEADEFGNVEKKRYTPYGDLMLCLEDGQTCSVGETGSVYRDEDITFQYTLSKNSGVELEALYFFTGEEEFWDPIYTWSYDEAKVNYNEKTGVSACSITFDSELIQEMEKKVGAYNLEDLYVIPIFQAKEAYFDLSYKVVETDEVEVIYESMDPYTGTMTYKIFEKNRDYDRNGILGTFTVTPIWRTGDDIVIDYTPNASYDGNYSFRYFEYRICESANQVNGSSYSIAHYSEDKPDLSTTVTDSYFWLRAHVALDASISIDDKTVTFSNEEVKYSADEATVTGTEGFPQPTGNIIYHYYEDEACTKEINVDEDGYPINAGVYYVTATLGQDDYYDVTVSEPAKLTIEKAVPVLKGLVGTSIDYGQNTVLNSTPSGTAYGVTGTKLPGNPQGTFTWKSETGSYPAPSDGYAKETVVFIPNELSSMNYTTAEGEATIVVNPVAPTITLADSEKTYDGESVTLQATVTGVNGEATGQQITYEYYRDETCKVKLSAAPTDAGTYYAKAYVRANENYSYKETTTAAEVVIHKKQGGLIQVPLTDHNYRVYVTNTVPGHIPEGKIKLTVLVNGYEMGSKEVEVKEYTEGENRMCYAQCTYGDITALTGGAREFYVRAEYVPVSGERKTENYEISSDEMAFGSTEPGKIAIHESVTLTYGGSAQIVDLTAIDSIKNANVSELTEGWSNRDNVSNGDVVDIGIDWGKGNSYIITPENAGTTTLIFEVRGTVSSSETMSWYVIYDITVKPATVEIALADKTVEYSGNPVTSDPATALINNVNCDGGKQDITSVVHMTYSYYQDEACTEKMTDRPVNVGTYYVKVKTDPQRNYTAGEIVRKITIGPTKPTILLSDKTVTYNGEEQSLDAPVVTGVDGDVEEITDESRKPSGTVKLLYNDKEDLPVDAGTYTVKAVYTPGDTSERKDNYAVCEEQATLTIDRAECTITLDPKEMEFTNQKADPNKLTFTGVDGEPEVIDNPTKENGYTYKYALASTVTSAEDYKEDVPSEAGFYYVYAIREEGGNYKRAISNRSTLWIKRAETMIQLDDATTTYNADPVDRGAIGNQPTVTDQTGKDITEHVKSEIEYLYYADKNGQQSIDAPTDAGIYYVRAILSSMDNYKNASSNLAKLTIEKAVPTLRFTPENVDSVGITYGQSVGDALIICKAYDVKGNDITSQGTLEWDSEIADVRPGKETDGQYWKFYYIPGSTIEKNYTEASSKEKIIVVPYATGIAGEDQTFTYTGEVVTSKEATLTGAEGMQEPVGTVEYRYYTDATCSEASYIGTDGVKDAGIYYCKAVFTVDENYRQLYINAESEPYRIEVKPADAIIDLQVPPLGKDLETGTVTVRGDLIGVFDDPTGTISLYQKSSDEAESAYQLVDGNIAIVQQADGSYGFSKEIRVAKGIYDFKAVYNKNGSKHNYNISDGEATDIDMSKDPQHITFETKLIRKVYGDDDWKVEAVEVGEHGTGKIRYSVIERLGNPDAITLESDGTVRIEDTGTAFIMAVKEGDDTYAPAYAFAAIQVKPAPTEVKLPNQTVTYTGKPVDIKGATVWSNGKEVSEDENVPVTYTYTYMRDGETVVLGSMPVDAGEYQVTAVSGKTDHYLASDPTSAMLIIEQAEAKIELSVKQVNEKEKMLLLNGTLSGVFDDPTGTVTLYQKLAGESEEAYTEAAKEIEITADDNGTYGFETVVDVELGQKYDFKAVYAEGSKKNYQITDGELLNVDIEEIIDDPDDSNDPDSDDKKPDGTDSDATNPDGSNSNELNRAVETGDRGNLMFWFVMLLISVAVVTGTRKHQRR